MSQASVLLVEDESLIRIMLIEMIEELGHKVVAEAGSVTEAQSLAEIEQYDLAILDINLQGAHVQPVAEMIRSRGLPFLFLSGYGSGGLPDGFEGTPVLNKPCSIEQLKRTMEILLASGANQNG